MMIITVEKGFLIYQFYENFWEVGLEMKGKVFFNLFLWRNILIGKFIFKENYDFCR